MKLKSFGCSFIYGSDLYDQIDIEWPPYSHSNLTWPALIAKKHNIEYECYAEPGIGNFKILSHIISQASLNDRSIFVINWTWIDRYDFVNSQEHWSTIRPSGNSGLEEMYYRHFHSQIKDMMTTIYAINTAVDFLRERNIPFVMSYIDYTMLDTVDPNWHDPKYISVMQSKIKDFLVDFQGKNFLDWSRDRGFKISESWHPLEDAHSAAADYMFPIFEKILHKK